MSSAVQDCYHCGEPVPAGADFTIELSGTERPMCCPGCRAVASLIANSGMENFYQQRTAYSARPQDDQTLSLEHYQVYDDPELLDSFSELESPERRRASLLLGGMTCAACTWLVERTLQRLPGVHSALVNLQQGKLDVCYNPELLSASELFARVEALGYKAQPFHGNAQRTQLLSEHKQALRRLAVAGLGMMQVGMFAIALHAGDIQGIAQQYQSLLRWVSMLVASFVVLYSARPFFIVAFRHLRQGALVMDLPVALAIGLAWLASVWATLSDSGQVYFDSVVMFTFFLLLGRFLEQRVRQRHALAWVDLEASLPAAVQVWRDDNWSTLPRQQLQPDDLILLRPGKTICADAVVTEGDSAVREDSFNGEYLPRAVRGGDTVYAGTLNLESPLQARVLGSYANTRLAALQKSVHSAQQQKPALARLADRIAAYFVGAILLITAVTATAWYFIDPGQALWITLSVLVISCPCALALATPAALTSAASALRAAGIIVRGENALEALSRCTHLLFDKTGTLTEGKLTVEAVVTLAELDRDAVLSLAAGLQQFSNHPIASAFSEYTPTPFDRADYRVGAGVEGYLREQRYRLGSVAFCTEITPMLEAAPSQPLYWIALVCEGRAVAWIGLGDRVRTEAQAVISGAKKLGLETELLTGDNSARGPELVAELNMPRGAYGLSPQDKMRRVSELQSQGAVVAMAGDGLNDAPVLALADASFAVAGATDLARTQADFVVLGEDLGALLRTVEKSRACRRIIIQNFAWALSYNVCAIPLAALGFIPPWLAAIGMSLSSLLVVVNSLRLNR